MGKPYYELHVTVLGNPADVKPFVEQMKWIFSAIDGDIVLGSGIKCYATRHLNCDKFSLDEATAAVQGAGSFLLSAGLNVIRQKVELVLVDMRF